MNKLNYVLCVGMRLLVAAVPGGTGCILEKDKLRQIGCERGKGRCGHPLLGGRLVFAGLVIVFAGTVDCNKLLLVMVESVDHHQGKQIE